MNPAEEIARLLKVVAEKEKTIQQLSEKAKWLDLIFEHAPINIYIKNSRGRFIAVNKEFERSFSISAAQLVDNLPVHLTEGELDVAQEHDRRVFESGLGSEQEEAIGGRIYRISKYPIFDAEGKAAFLIGFDVDVTDLNRAQQELLERNRELEAFSYMAAHDLKAPLRRIQGEADMLVQDQRERVSCDAFEQLDHISRSAASLGQLIDDLLQLGALGTGAVHFEPGAIPALLATVAQEFAELNDKPEERAIQVSGPFPVLEGSSLALKLVFRNLLENSLKFVAPGVAPSVVVTAEEQDGLCTIAIRDNGIGIAAEHREDIFGAFKRLHSSDVYPGSGIGLAIVKKGVRLNNGAVWVESETGEGSTFFVRLPGARPRIRSDLRSMPGRRAHGRHAAALFWSARR